MSYEALRDEWLEDNEPTVIPQGVYALREEDMLGWKERRHIEWKMLARRNRFEAAAKKANAECPPEIARLAAEGKSDYEIAQITGLPRSTIGRHRRGAGIESGYVQAQADAFFAKLPTEFTPHTEIAEIYGMKPKSIRVKLNKSPRAERKIIDGVACYRRK